MFCSDEGACVRFETILTRETGGLVHVSGRVNGGTIDSAPTLQRRGFRVR